MFVTDVYTEGLQFSEDRPLSETRVVLLLNIIKQMAGVRNVLSGDEAARQDSGLHPERTAHPYQFYNRLFT